MTQHGIRLSFWFSFEATNKEDQDTSTKKTSRLSFSPSESRANGAALNRPDAQVKRHQAEAHRKTPARRQEKGAQGREEDLKKPAPYPNAGFGLPHINHPTRASSNVRCRLWTTMHSCPSQNARAAKPRIRRGSYRCLGFTISLSNVSDMAMQGYSVFCYIGPRKQKNTHRKITEDISLDHRV